MVWLERKKPNRLYSVGDRVETIDGRVGTITSVYLYECPLPYVVLVDEYNIINFFAERSIIRKIGSVEMEDTNIAVVIGDVAMLRSGGPYMTVEQLNGHQVGCVWFDKHDVRHVAYFEAICLQKVEA